MLLSVTDLNSGRSRVTRGEEHNQGQGQDWEIGRAEIAIASGGGGERKRGWREKLDEGIGESGRDGWRCREKCAMGE